MPAPAPISTSVNQPTIIATPPSATGAGPLGSRFHTRSQHPMMLHGGPSNRISAWLDQALTFIPRRRRQIRYPIAIAIGLYLFVSYLYFKDVSTWTTVAGFKYKNLAFNWDVKRCSYRKDPMLFVQDSNSVLVIWEMNCKLPGMDLTWVPASDTVDFEDSRKAETSFQALDKTHVVYTAKLTGMPAQNINITYSINPPRVLSHLYRTYTFAHLPNPPSLDHREIARFGAISDNQCEVSQFLKVLKAMTEHHKVDYLIHAGDAVQDHDSLDNWQTDFSSPMSHFRVSQTTPLIYAHGNHDYDPQGLYPYTGARKWHAYTLAGVRFIILDSNINSSEQDRWLEDELKSEASKKAWFRLIVVHMSPYTQYWERDAWENKGEKHWGSFVRTKYVPLFQQHGVDLVISGHQHNYMRGQDEHMVYTIIGGAGGQLDEEQVEDYPVWKGGKVKVRHHYVLMKITGDRRLIWEAYDADCGSRLDAFVLHSRTEEVL
jgi:predicted phosphodiesterase